MARPVNPARAAAMKAGERTYQGETCPQGHTGGRYTHNRACVECQAAWQRAKRIQVARDFTELLG